MNPVGALIIFILVWWGVFFAVLPFGVRGRWESPDDGVAGAEPGAPASPNLKRKFIQTTAIAAVLSAAIIAFIASGVVNFRD
jgi:predicted secreted protein